MLPVGDYVIEYTASCKDDIAEEKEAIAQHGSAIPVLRLVIFSPRR